MRFVKMLSQATGYNAKVRRKQYQPSKMKKTRRFYFYIHLRPALCRHFSIISKIHMYIIIMKRAAVSRSHQFKWKEALSIISRCLRPTYDRSVVSTAKYVSQKVLLTF